MAAITLNKAKNTVQILVERSDLIRTVDGKEITIASADICGAGHLFVNEEIPLCMIRGERK